MNEDFYKRLQDGGIRIQSQSINGDFFGNVFVTKPVTFRPYEAVMRDMLIDAVSEDGMTVQIRLDDLSYLLGSYQSFWALAPDESE